MLDYIAENRNVMLLFLAFALVVGFVTAVFIINQIKRELLEEVLVKLKLEDIDLKITEFDDQIVVKSRQTLNNYTDLKYLKDHDALDKVVAKSQERKQIRMILSSFLKGNVYEKVRYYSYVEEQLEYYLKRSNGYRVKLVYITPAGNNLGERVIHLTEKRINEIVAHPEYLMSKSEYNKLIKQQGKLELEATKGLYYNRINELIDFANQEKPLLIVKSKTKDVDELIQSLFDRTINSIQKVKSIESDEWKVLDNYISTIDSQVHQIIANDKKISEYYASEDFAKIKETCRLLTESQKEFNEYINEKAKAFESLFGTRVVRNETQIEDVNNYIRPYQKSITPFTAEVSSTVFGSAENNPIEYVIKYFYSNKSQYKNQIDKLRILLEELETLKEAKIIIDNYKADYNQYIQNVPTYVIENDENGFYSRLGLAVIDEAILNVEYRFTYTSNGGMAQRSFSIPMTEDNIVELIHQLENKLTKAQVAKEQRALMTTKLRNYIKQRDKFTCCQCGNSVNEEPNLLLEIDHIIPVSKGGLTIEDNLQTLCWKCNRSKGAKILLDDEL
ncbi:HNH endonuclease [Agathobacter ruminis]|uniref:HNH nuclease domain-containing protein n=1 Tax=Agathobacter ruminis TaxID=1712665 RepID=A0A2G3E369_9FIRM|nr:HNH endonuclease signature motif containing protein [Agathobacter ruminis]MDC7301570.1 HNH endonuclease [Agathobacter ruminis]PHU37717.1 hypothetical protein CSX02_06425 [Agathobacter ruminis]